MGLIALPLVPPALVALGEAVAFVGSAALVAWGVHETAQVISSEMSKAETEAQTQTKAETKTITCATCKENPCAALACGVPGSKYRGGAHGCMTGTDATKGDGLDSHHAPADSASPLNRQVGPALQMDAEDHWMTASNGRMPGSKAYIATQKSLIDSGNFMAASAMDVADIRAKFGNKYDSAIAQMEAYTACLKQHGLIK